MFDCLIIGGGPAGLAAATYLGRFRRKVVLVDAGESRAKWIPSTHNCPGFPDGIAGTALLGRFPFAGRQVWGKPGRRHGPSRSARWG